MKIKGFFFFLLLLYGGYAQAQELHDSVKIYFRQGYSVLDLSRRNNKQSLDR